jgi:hypothetical protein
MENGFNDESFYVKNESFIKSPKFERKIIKNQIERAFLDVNFVNLLDFCR